MGAAATSSIPPLIHFSRANPIGSLTAWHNREPRGFAKGLLLSGGALLSEGEMTSSASASNQTLAAVSEGFRPVQMLDATAIDLCNRFQESVMTNRIHNPMIEKLIKVHLGEAADPISPEDIDLGHRSIAEVFKIFAHKLRLLVPASLGLHFNLPERHRVMESEVACYECGPGSIPVASKCLFLSGIRW